MTTTAWVFTGGDAPHPDSLADLHSDDLVIAADAGLAHALVAGVAVDVIVGDLDSVDAKDLDRAVAAGARVEQHPTDKDATDLELALHAAGDAGVQSITVVGIGGGRLDHLLANLLVLSAPVLVGVDVEAHIDRTCIHIIRAGRPRTLAGQPGDILTLLPIGGTARGVRVTGVLWELADEDLEPGSTRGVSNRFAGAAARVSLDDGVLIAIQPSTPPTRGSTAHS